MHTRMCACVFVFYFERKQQHNARHWKLTTFSLYETDMWTVARVRALYARRECVLNSTLNICFQHIRTCFLSSFSCHNVCQVSFFHSMSAFASIFRNMYNGAFSIEWFVYFEIPNRNRLNFPFHWEILQSICGFVTQKKVMITNYSLHRKRKSRCWHLHGNAVVCNAKQYNQYMKIIRKLPISGSLYFTCLNCVLQGLDGILSQNQLFVASFWIVAKNNKVCKRRKCLMFIVLIRILIVFFSTAFLDHFESQRIEFDQPQP